MYTLHTCSCILGCGINKLLISSALPVYRLIYKIISLKSKSKSLSLYARLEIGPECVLDGVAPWSQQSLQPASKPEYFDALDFIKSHC